MIGKTLRYIRTIRNLKQGDIASKINVKSNALSQYETGDRQPTFETIEKIANICDFTIYFVDNQTKEKYTVQDIVRK